MIATVEEYNMTLTELEQKRQKLLDEVGTLLCVIGLLEELIDDKEKAND